MAINSGCAKRPSASADNVLRISQRNEPATTDPQLATLPDEFFIIRALKEGLLVPNPAGGAPLPGVAERWEISADGLTYTFHLRANACWANGRALTAGDFVHSIRRALTPATAAPKAHLFFCLAHAEDFYRGRITDATRIGASAPDPRQLVLRLAQPTPDLPALVASGPWIPVYPHVRHENGVDVYVPGRDMGNGPFMVTGWHANQRITVTKNPLYWNAAAVQLDRIQFLAFDNGDSEERAFRAGQLDVTMAVPVTKLAGYRAAQPPVLHSVPLHETRYLALNTRRPPLNDPRVRQALALALDRTALVDKVLQGGQQPAFNFVPAGLGGYAPGARITEDADEARRLLAAAGFPAGHGFPRLEMSTWVNTPVLEAVQQMWKRELGLEVALAQREARTHLAALASGDYAIAFMTAIPDYDGASDLFTQLTTGHAANYPHWSSAEYDRLAAAAQWAPAEKILLGEMPLIPLYFNAQNFLVAPRVRGWRADRLWTRFYRGLSVE